MSSSHPAHIDHYRGLSRFGLDDVSTTSVDNDERVTHLSIRLRAAEREVASRIGLVGEEG